MRRQKIPASQRLTQAKYERGLKATITTGIRLEARSCILSGCLRKYRQGRCDAIKSGGAPLVAVHFDATIMHRVTYASLPPYLVPVPFPPPPSHIPGIDARHLSGIFKCILLDGGSPHRRDFPTRIRRWERKGGKGFSSLVGMAQRRHCVSERRSTAAQMYSRRTLFQEPYPSILSGESDARSYERGLRERERTVKSIRINSD